MSATSGYRVELKVGAFPFILGKQRYKGYWEELGLLSNSTGKQTYIQQTPTWVFHPSSLCTPFLKVRSRCTCLTLFLACWQVLDGLCPGKPIAHSQQKAFNYINKMPCSLSHQHHQLQELSKSLVSPRNIIFPW